MLKNLAVFDAASARMEHSSKRHSLIASNIAHVDTPRYVGKDLQNFTLNIDNLTQKATRPTHLNFNENQDKYSSLKEAITQESFDETWNKNKISVEEEMAKAAEAQSSYEFSSAVWKKSMDLFLSVVSPRG